MTVRIESNSYLTEEQHQVYTLRESLERNGGTPVGFLELLATIVREGTWRKIPSGVSQEEPFASFVDFIEAKPPFGLGSSVDQVRILLKLRHPNEGVPRIREEMDAMRAAVTELIGADPEKDPVTRDTRDFGGYAQQGAWIFGLMVARSVRKAGGPRPGKTVSESNDQHERPSRAALGNQKVSATEFAERAGCGVDRVSRHLNAWERAAEAGLVPHAKDLNPGQDIELPAAETWGQFYLFYETTSDRRESIAAVAEEIGTSYKKAVEITANRSAMRAAILGDPKTAEMARDALMERPEIRAEVISKVLADPVVRREAAVETRKAERAEYVRHVAADGKCKTPAGQVLELPAQAKEEAVKLLAVVDDPRATPEAVAEAYEAAQELTAKIIEGDPEVQLREQRTRFSKALSSTAKSIQAIDPDDLAAVADDELRTKLAELQQQVNDLAALVVEPKPGHLRAV
ncbi:hypothetical protein [Kitasatospora purpeofusca]|uniref:hypothetical protein n=1 Tax=Kitasatospora purpeofusca TaxID=67352 RepID=UPI00380E0AB6